MAFVPRYKHDIFVSYAHVDDQPLPGATEGWVTTLIKGLRTRLSAKLGRNDAYDLWIDHELSRSAKITPQIMDVLGQTAALLLILSPGYIESDWCQREKNAFLGLIKEKIRSGSRIFIVERDKIENSERPAEFDEIIGYRFWVQEQEGRSPRILGMPVPNPDDIRYYDMLNDLVHELAKELKCLKLLAEEPQTEISQPIDRPTVFLAEATDDLDPQRDDVKRYLDQAGIEVVPAHWYSREPQAFRHAVDGDIAKCKLFVQLLSATAGKKSPDLPQGYVQLQFECARAAKIPLLQWRSRDLDVSGVADDGHRTLLESESVLAVGIEEFKREIVNQAFYRLPAPIPKPINAFLFVDMDRSDRTMAGEVCKFLDQYGAEYALPLQAGKPSEIRKDLEQNLLDCDGVIIIYGNITAVWVREQLRQCRKILARRESPLRALAVFEGPPEQKTPLDLKLRNMQIINCRRGLEESELKAFFAGLQPE